MVCMVCIFRLQHTKNVSSGIFWMLWPGILKNEKGEREEEEEGKERRKEREREKEGRREGRESLRLPVAAPGAHERVGCWRTTATSGRSATWSTCTISSNKNQSGLLDTRNSFTWHSAPSRTRTRSTRASVPLCHHAPAYLRRWRLRESTLSRS